MHINCTQSIHRLSEYLFLKKLLNTDYLYDEKIMIVKTNFYFIRKNNNFRKYNFVKLIKYEIFSTILHRIIV